MFDPDVAFQRLPMSASASRTKLLNRMQRLIAIAGLILLSLHSLFPPRTYKWKEESAGRAFIFSEDFDKADIANGKMASSIEINSDGNTRTYNSTRIDYDRFVMLGVTIAALTLAVVVSAGSLDED